MSNNKHYISDNDFLSEFLDYYLVLQVEKTLQGENSAVKELQTSGNSERSYQLDVPMSPCVLIENPV